MNYKNISFMFFLLHVCDVGSSHEGVESSVVDLSKNPLPRSTIRPQDPMMRAFSQIAKHQVSIWSNGDFTLQGSRGSEFRALPLTSEPSKKEELIFDDSNRAVDRSNKVHGVLVTDRTELPEHDSTNPVRSGRQSAIAARLSAEQLQSFKSLHAELQSSEFNATLRPVLAKLCDVEAMTKLVSDIVDKNGDVPDMEKRCADLLRMQTDSFDIGRLRLEGVKLTPALRQELMKFMESCNPLFALALPKETVLRDSLKTIVEALPLEAQENLCSTALYSLGRVKRSKSNKVVIISALVALNLSIVLLFLFGDKQEEHIAQYLIITEMVMLGVAAMGSSGGKPPMIQKE